MFVWNTGAQLEDASSSNGEYDGDMVIGMVADYDLWKQKLSDPRYFRENIKSSSTGLSRHILDLTRFRRTKK